MIIQHLTNILKPEIAVMRLVIQLFSVIGGMGVLLFFFVSGYGIYKGYAHKTPNVGFLHRRLINVYLPCLFIQSVFRLIEAVRTKALWGGLFLESLQEAWFIYVIMIQYFVFFISWTVSKGRQELLLILNFILSLAVATALYFTNVNARWYNGLLLFPIGMTVACYEKKLLASFQKNWLLHLGLHLIIFILAGGAFTYVKGSSAAADLLKMLAGASMGLLVCIIYMRVRSVSGIMRYIGRRSLFFYLVHLELRSAITKLENMDSVTAFYLILPLTFILSEIFYALCQRATEKIWKRRNTEAMGKISKETSGLIRAVAMLMVVTAHFSQWYTKAADAGVVVGLLTKLGRYGVAMFFAISGYGLVSSALSGLDRSYFKKRLANVYLPYLVLSFLIRLFTADGWSFRELCLWLGGCDAWFVSVILVFYIIFYYYFY